MDWKKKCELLFFVESLGILEIAAEVKKSRKAVGEFLKTCAGFEAERQRRQRVQAQKRVEYQRQWDKDKRVRPKQENLSGFFLKRQHEIDVRVLSREQYF